MRVNERLTSDSAAEILHGSIPNFVTSEVVTSAPSH